ncbi:hypothetical protein, partial [Streptomyces albireticuli]
MRSTSAHTAVTRIAAVAVAALALGGCMSVSDPERPASSPGADKRREAAPEPDGGVRIPGGRPGRPDARAVKGASGSPAARGATAASSSASPSDDPEASPEAVKPGKPGGKPKPPGSGPGTVPVPGKPPAPSQAPPPPPSSPA